MGCFEARRRWGRRTRPYWSFFAAVAEFLFWAACALHLKAWNRLLHFTWWGIIVHVVTVFVDVVSTADWHTDVCVQTAVVTGVWYMSACKCDMLVEAEAEMGTLQYAGGNFLVHYVPLISALARMPSAMPTVPTPSALLLWLAYNALSTDFGVEPSKTYGCNAPYELVLMVGASTILLSAFLFHSF